MTGKHLRKTDEGAAPVMGETSRRVTLACWAVAILIVVAVCLLQCPKYATPDDFIQDLYVRGAYHDMPSLIMPYSMIAFSAPVALLYRIAPVIPWFPLIMFAMLVVSFASVANLVCRTNAPRRVKAVLLVALACGEVITSIYFSYTIVAFVACAAGLTLVLSEACYARPQRINAPIVGGLVLFFVGFSLRVESGTATVLMFVSFAIWALARNRNARTIALGVTVVLLMAVSYGTGHFAWRHTPGWEQFDQTADAARSIADYPHLTGDEAREAVPTMSDNDVKMIYEFLFTDSSTFDYDTFTALDTKVHGYGLGTFKSAVLERKSFTAFVLGLVVVVALFSAWLSRTLGLRGASRALMWSVPVMTLVEYLVVFLRARPKLHVILPVFAIAFFALVLCCVAPRKGGRAKTRTARPVVPVLLGIVLLAVTAFVEVKFARPNQASMRVEASTNAQEYVEQNPDKLVMFAHTQGLIANTDCLSFESWRTPDNALFAGGYEQYTQAWADNAASWGLSSDGLFLEFLDSGDRVAVANSEQAEMLRTYIAEHSGRSVVAHMDASLGMGSGGIEYGVWSFATA